MFVARHQILYTGDVTIYIHKLLLPMTIHMANIVLYMLPLTMLTNLPNEFTKGIRCDRRISPSVNHSTDTIILTYS